MRYVNNRKTSIYLRGVGQVMPGSCFDYDEAITMRGIDQATEDDEIAAEAQAEAVNKEQGADPE